MDRDVFQTYFRFVTMYVNSVYIFEHLLLSYNKEFLAWGTLENIQVPRPSHLKRDDHIWWRESLRNIFIVFKVMGGF